MRLLSVQIRNCYPSEAGSAARWLDTLFVLRRHRGIVRNDPGFRLGFRYMHAKMDPVLIRDESMWLGKVYPLTSTYSFRITWKIKLLGTVCRFQILKCHIVSCPISDFDHAFSFLCLVRLVTSARTLGSYSPLWDPLGSIVQSFERFFCFFQ